MSEQGESNPVISNKAIQIVYKRQHLPPVPISNRRQSYVNSVFHTQKKIHPVIFYRLAVITRITLLVYWKGTEKWHSTSHQCWQYSPPWWILGISQWVVIYLWVVLWASHVGGHVGGLGRAQRGTRGHVLVAPLGMKSLEPRFGESCEGRKLDAGRIHQ